MKILHRSILKELILAFVLSLASLNFILMAEKLLRLSRVLSGVGISPVDMAKLIAYIQPPLLLLTIPMALLLSTLLVYGRLNFDNELVIMRMSGMNFTGIIAPVAVLGAVCCLVNTAVSFSLGPKSTMALRNEMVDIVKKRTPLAIEEGRFHAAFRDVLIFVREKPSQNTLRGVFVYDGRNQQEPRVMVAREGMILVQDGFTIHLLLHDGYINMVKDDNITEVFFKTYSMALGLEPGEHARKIPELTLFELMGELKTTGDERVVALYLELSRRVSLPLMCIILIFIGPPLATIAGRSGRLGGLTIGLVVFAVYYLLLIYGENLARAGRIPYYIGAWSATVTLGAAAVVAFLKEYRR